MYMMNAEPVSHENVQVTEPSARFYEYTSTSTRCSILFLAGQLEWIAGELR